VLVREWVSTPADTGTTSPEAMGTLSEVSCLRPWGTTRGHGVLALATTADETREKKNLGTQGGGSATGS